MAKLSMKPELKISITLSLTEEEARALLELTSYGDHEFLKMFYTHLGTFGLQPYENGLKSLFHSVKEILSPILNKIDKIRKQLEE